MDNIEQLIQLLLRNHFQNNIIDLTHTLSAHIPTWNGCCGFHAEVKLDYSDCPTPVKFRVQQLKMHGSIGTHMDAPLHCFEEGISIAEIPLQNLIGPAIKIDVSHKCDERLIVSLQEIHDFEASHGVIEPGTIVFIQTGWGKFWNTPQQYHNNHIFPCVDGAVAEYLVYRNIRGLGIDTLAPDRPEIGFPVHHALLGANKWIVENVANLDALPSTGSLAFALPLKGGGVTEAPVRLMAIGV